MARLSGSSIRPGPSLRGLVESPPSRAEAIDLATSSPALASRPSETLRERIDYIREAWAQTTFYLFDPQSWR